MAADPRPQAHRAALFRLDHLLLLCRRDGRDPDPHPSLDPVGPVSAEHLQPAVHDARHRHGVVLSDPVDPDHLRQFPGAADDRRPRPGLSEDQSRQLVRVQHLRAAAAGDALPRRRRHRLDLLRAVLDAVFQQLRRDGGAGGVHQRVFLDHDRAQFRRLGAPAARPGHDLEPAAPVRLGDLCDEPRHAAGDAGAGDGAVPGGGRSFHACRHLRPDARRRPAALSAYVLVLFASRRLHHDPAGDGRDQRAGLLLRPQADLWLHRHDLRA